MLVSLATSAARAQHRDDRPNVDKAFLWEGLKPSTTEGTDLEMNRVRMRNDHEPRGRCTSYLAN